MVTVEEKEISRKQVKTNVENDIKEGKLENNLSNFLEKNNGNAAMVDFIMSIKYPEVKNSGGGGRKIKKNKTISY